MEKGKTKSICSMIMPILHSKTDRETNEAFDLEILEYAPYFPDLAPSNLMYSHHWNTLLLNNTSTCMKRYENASMTVLLQKKNCFFDVAFINCQRGWKNS